MTIEAACINGESILLGCLQLTEITQTLLTDASELPDSVRNTFDHIFELDPKTLKSEPLAGACAAA